MFKSKIIFLPLLWESRSAIMLPSPILRTFFILPFIYTYIASRTPVGCLACTMCLSRELKTHARLLLPWKAFSFSLPLSLSAFTCGAELKRLNDRVAPFIRESSSPFSRHKFWNEIAFFHQAWVNCLQVHWGYIWFKPFLSFWLDSPCQVSLSAWKWNFGKWNTFQLAWIQN